MCDIWFCKERMFLCTPSILPGPMLLFEKYVAGKVVHERYYACSACRNHKDCNAFMLEDDFKMRSTAKEVNDL